MKQPPKRLFPRRADRVLATLPTGVGIGAADEAVIDRIAEAVERQRPDLAKIRFSAPQQYMDVFQPRDRRDYRHGWITLVFVCVDPPTRIRLAGDAGPNFREIATGLIKRVNVIAISKDVLIRQAMREAGCLAAFTLEEVINRIPKELETWLIRRS